MIDARWEVGSEFDWSGGVLEGRPVAAPPWPEPNRLFASGRAALLALARSRGGERPRLHLPTFFCTEVASALAEAFDLSWFPDLPGDEAPDLTALRPRPGDLVLAVNFFGARDPAPWLEWTARHDDVLVVENHTHSPLSPWACESRAAFAIASLRKTLPVPDGALLWSGAGRPLPGPQGTPPSGAYRKLAAMVLKHAWLRGAPVSKERFRHLQITGEETLEHDLLPRATEFSSEVLSCLDARRLFERRERNVAHLLRLVAGLPGRGWRPLFGTWPAGATPFNLVLACRGVDVRERLRVFLVEHGVFACVHWRQDDGPSPDDQRARDLAGRLLTVPADHRYSRQDMEQVAEVLARFR